MTIRSNVVQSPALFYIQTIYGRGHLLPRRLSFKAIAVMNRKNLGIKHVYVESSGTDACDLNFGLDGLRKHNIP